MIKPEVTRDLRPETIMSTDYSIGALAAKSGVNIPTIRYYEQAGLLEPPPRTSGGHRVYSKEHLQRLNFIKQSRDLDFSLDEIRHLLKLIDEGYSCEEVRGLACEHLERIRKKIKTLKHMESLLAGVIANCDGGKKAQCPVIDFLLFDHEE